MTNEIMKFQDVQNIAAALVASGYFKDAGNEAQAIVKVLAGREMGVGPFAAMTGIHIIQGKPVLGANVLATLIKNDRRYNYRVTEHTAKVCSIEFYENGQLVGVSSVTLDELRKAGSKNLDKYPKNMLFARAISNGAKWHTPGIFGGAPVYTPDEFGLDVDDEGDPVIEAQSRPVTREMVAPPAPPAPPAPHPSPEQYADDGKPVKRNFSDTQLEAVAEFFDNPFHAQNALAKASPQALPKNASAARLKVWAECYSTLRAEGMDSTIAAEHSNRAVKEEAAKRK